MQPRLRHLDNLRFAMVFCVLTLHAILAYDRMNTWWYAADPDKLPGLEALTYLLDSFPLPLLFFLAGFFAETSLLRHGTKQFIVAKLRRLGFPLLVVVPTLIPAIAWYTFTTRGIHTPPAPLFWRTFLTDGLLPDHELVTSVPDYSLQAVSFSQFHLWFISLLLCFMLVHPLVRRLLPHPGRTAPRTFAVFAFSVCAMAASMATLSATIPEWSWLNLDWLLFQPVRLPLYYGMFLLGAMAQRAGWLQAGVLPGPLRLWVPALLLALGAYFTVSLRMMLTSGPLPFHLGFVQGMVRCVLCLSVLAVLLRAFRRTGAKKSRMMGSLARSSYVIYLLHLPICVFLQAQLLPSRMPAGLKLCAVLALSLAIPWAIAVCMRRLPRKLNELPTRPKQEESA
jgi:peptidoglycan/LPS O-acetylase OafA/YrhL